MQRNNPTIIVLLALLLLSLPGCADNPTQPELTEEDVARIVAEELAKMAEAEEEAALTPQQIAKIALRSTALLQVKTEKDSVTATGFFVGDGWIVTCYHIVKGMKTGNVTLLLDEKKYPISGIKAVDEPRDLAVVQAKTLNAPSLVLADSNAVQIGDAVFVVSNPKKIKGTFSVGIVSNRSIRHDLSTDELLQITAPVSTGSSGGPVLNIDGEVIGVVVGGRADGQLLNFAIPVNQLKALLSTIR